MQGLHKTNLTEVRGSLPAKLLFGVSTLALGAALWTGSAAAQTAAPASAASQGGDQSTVSEVVVTGIRQSLKHAQDIKQAADVHVDAITAEDIGALPDRSVTEALQRVPGVAINRFAGANDPDHFSVEGQGVVVRGLTFVRSEFNGRDTFGAGPGQTINFSDVPAELLGSVEVFKDTSANMIEGGIAGTVNLNTRKPFDNTGQVFSINVDGSYGDMDKKWSPSMSALYSNRWSTGLGEFGVLVDLAKTQVRTHSDGLQVHNYYARTDLVPGKTVYAPTGADYRTQDWMRKRQGQAVALQWRSPDRTMEATFQYLRTSSRTAWSEVAVETATDVVTGGSASSGTGTAQLGNPNTIPLPGTSYTFDNAGLFESGIITQQSGWRSADPTVPLNGMQSQIEPRSVDQRDRTTDWGST